MVDPDPRHNFSIFIATNQDQSSVPFEIATAVANEIVGINSKLPQRDIPLPQSYPSQCGTVEEATNYTGTYRHPAYGTLIVEERGAGELQIRFESSPKGTGPLPLCLEENSLFALKINRFVFRLQFKTIDGKGVIDSILFDVNSLNTDSASFVVFTKKCGQNEECHSTSAKWADVDFPTFPLNAYTKNPFLRFFQETQETCSQEGNNIVIICLLSGALIIALGGLLYQRIKLRDISSRRGESFQTVAKQIDMAEISQGTNKYHLIE